MKSNFFKLNSLNPMCKYEFSNQLINHLGIKSKTYTINEMTELIKTNFFKGKTKKNISWEDKDIFKVKGPSISFSYVIKYIMNHYIIKEANEPDCIFYYYYQTQKVY